MGEQQDISGLELRLGKKMGQQWDTTSLMFPRRQHANIPSSLGIQSATGRLHCLFTDIYWKRNNLQIDRSLIKWTSMLCGSPVTGGINDGKRRCQTSKRGANMKFCLLNVLVEIILLRKGQGNKATEGVILDLGGEGIG
ncbi:hypothetical protein E2320_014691 [Naja naja]|nr:hypothetical protein E2320_014691 [Naja naja]